MADDIVSLVMRAEAVLQMQPARRADECGPIIRQLIEALKAAHPNRNFNADCEAEVLHMQADQDPVVLATVPASLDLDRGYAGFRFWKAFRFPYSGPTSQLYISVKRGQQVVFFGPLISVIDGLGSHCPEGCTVEVRPDA